MRAWNAAEKTGFFIFTRGILAYYVKPAMKSRPIMERGRFGLPGRRPIRCSVLSRRRLRSCTHLRFPNRYAGKSDRLRRTVFRRPQTKNLPPRLFWIPCKEDALIHEQSILTGLNYISSNFQFVCTRSRLEIFTQVCEGNARDAFQRFFGQECLVRCDDNVWPGYKDGQNIVFYDDV